MRCFAHRYQYLISKKTRRLTDLDVLNIKIENVEDVLARRKSAQQSDSGEKIDAQLILMHKTFTFFIFRP